MLTVLALSLLQAPPPSPEAEPIVVVGTRIDDDRDRLAACLARRCPPLEDMAASLRYAETLFIAGRYVEARRLLAAAIDRNAGHSARYPRAVAGLYRAHARVSIHQGEGDHYARSTYRIVRALSDGLPEQSAEVLLGRLEVGDMQLGLNRVQQAERSYRRTEAAAAAAGQPGIAALARLRAAWLLHLTGKSREAQRELDGFAAAFPEVPEVYRLAARIVSARIGRAQGDSRATDALVAEFARSQAQDRLVMIWSPSLAEAQRAPAPSATALEPRLALSRAASEGHGISWVDIGFWVRPDGTVHDAEILRAMGGTGWTAPVLRAVGGRLYAPFAGDPAAPGRYRIERFSYTALWGIPPGSRIRTRIGPPRVETMDLTEEPPAPAQ